MSPGLICFGEALTDLPTTGGDGVLARPGGAPCNVARAAAGPGLRGAWAGCISRVREPLGARLEALARRLKAQGARIAYDASQRRLMQVPRDLPRRQAVCRRGGNDTRRTDGGAMKALSLWLGLAAAAQADPGYYQVRPYSEPGQTTLELRYWATSNNSRPRAHWPELGLRHGFGPRWSSGLLASWISARHIPSRLDSWNWINDWLLLDGVGAHSFSLALHSQLIRSKGGERTLELGPALQADAGRWQGQLTLLAERPLNGERRTELKLQWQLSRRLQPGWRLGLQGFSELGPWDALSSASGQSHRAGPLLSFSHDLGQGQALQLQAAWLFGKTFGRSGSMLSTRLAYGF